MLGTQTGSCETALASPPPMAQQRTAFRPGLVVLLAAIAYAVIVVSHWSEGYIDFGDGNYLYISWRLSEGAVLYRDVLAPQPPLHLMTGWMLAKLAGFMGLPGLYTFRAFSVLLHVLMACIVAWLGRGVCRVLGKEEMGAAVGTLAAVIYLLLPIGFWWSLGYQSEPLEIVFLYGSLGLLLRGCCRGSAVLAGLVAALATLTNMTAAPYALVFLLYLAVRERDRWLPYAVAFFGLWGAVTFGMEAATGAYLENVILNQVGSFPRKEFLPPGETLLTYAWRKITSEGRDILALEGGYIVLALVGLYGALRACRPSAKVELACWSALGLMASVVYVSKGGTMDYIFTIGEPAVALFAAWFIVMLHRGWKTLDEERAVGAFLLNTLPLLRWVVGCVIGVVVIGPGLGFVWRTLRQETYELDAYRTRQVVELMRQHAKENDVVLAPPFYAFLAKRRIIEDYSEIFLWTLKYYNEKQDGVRGRGVVTVEKIAAALRAQNVAFVALDLDQTGKIPEIRSAIEAFYQPLRQKEFRTLNTRLMFYVPRRAAAGGSL